MGQAQVPQQAGVVGFSAQGGEDLVAVGGVEGFFLLAPRPCAPRAAATCDDPSGWLRSVRVVAMPPSTGMTAPVR